MKGVSKVSTTSRRRGLLVLSVAALLVVPAAISWACGPNRDIGPDRINYTPGQTVTVVGGNWYPSVSVTITINGETVATTTTTVANNLQASFAAPATPGTYTVVANATDPTNGGDLSKSTSITVVPAQASPSPSNPAPSQGGGATPRQGTASAPGTTSGGSRGSAGDNSRSVNGGERVGSGAARRVATGAGVLQSAGTRAFAGSVSRAARVDAATRGDSQSAENAAAGRPSERSAGADLWSGLVSSKNPSLMPAGNDQSAPGADTGPGLAWALALLGAGSLALLGLGFAEAQRRRSRAPTR